MIDTILNNKKLLILGWILGALLVLGYNATTLKDMLNFPTIRKPNIIMMVTQKSDQYKNMESDVQENEKVPVNLDKFISKFKRYLPENDLIGLKPDKNKADANETAPPLPHLSGIIHIRNIEDKQKSFAVIDGKKVGEKDKINGFKVNRISKEGVTLTKAGKRWFLKAPDINYSLDATQ